MQNKSLPSPYSSQYDILVHSKNEVCFSSKNGESSFWSSCNDIVEIDNGSFEMGAKSIEYLDTLQVMDLKLNDECFYGESLEILLNFLKNEQLLKTLHIVNWGSSYDKCSVFSNGWTEFLEFSNELSLEDYMIKLEIIDKNYPFGKSDYENSKLIEEGILQCEKINKKPFFKIDFHYYKNWNSVDWIPIKNPNNLKTQKVFLNYNPNINFHEA